MSRVWKRKENFGWLKTNPDRIRSLIKVTKTNTQTTKWSYFLRVRVRLIFSIRQEKGKTNKKRSIWASTISQTNCSMFISIRHWWQKVFTKTKYHLQSANIYWTISYLIGVFVNHFQFFVHFFTIILRKYNFYK